MGIEKYTLWYDFGIIKCKKVLMVFLARFDQRCPYTIYHPRFHTFSNNEIYKLKCIQLSGVMVGLSYKDLVM